MRPMDSPSVPVLVVNSGQPKAAKESTLLFAGDFYLRPGHSFQDQRDLLERSGIKTALLLLPVVKGKIDMTPLTDFFKEVTTN